jgi:hypothetical protein
MMNQASLWHPLHRSRWKAGERIDRVGAPLEPLSKGRVARKTCHLVALCIATWAAGNIIGVALDCFGAASAAAQGLAGLVDLLVCLFAVCAALAAFALCTVLEGVVLAITAADTVASEAQRRREWSAAARWAAPAGLLLLWLALAGAWSTW